MKTVHRAERNASAVRQVLAFQLRRDLKRLV